MSDEHKPTTTPAVILTTYERDPYPVTTDGVVTHIFTFPLHEHYGYLVDEVEEKSGE